MTRESLYLLECVEQGWKIAQRSELNACTSPDCVSEKCAEAARDCPESPVSRRVKVQAHKIVLSPDSPVDQNVEENSASEGGGAPARSLQGRTAARGRPQGQGGGLDVE